MFALPRPPLNTFVIWLELVRGKYIYVPVNSLALAIVSAKKPGNACQLIRQFLGLCFCPVTDLTEHVGFPTSLTGFPMP